MTKPKKELYYTVNIVGKLRNLNTAVYPSLVVRNIVSNIYLLI